MDTKVSETLMFLAKNAQLRFHLKLTKKDEAGVELPDSLIKTYTMQGKSYFHVDMNAYATMEIRDGEWEMNKSIMVTKNNIYQLILGFEQIITNIQIQDTFIEVDNEIQVNPEVVKERIVTIFNLGGSNRVLLEPITIYVHHEDLTYEGCRVFINTSNNFFDITFDMIYAVLHQLKKIDFSVYAHNLMRAYVDKQKLDDTMEAQGNVTTNRYRTQHALFQDPKNEGGTSSTMKPPTKDLINIE